MEVAPSTPTEKKNTNRDLYNFPPFFTLQPNVNVRENQLSEWGSVISATRKPGGFHYLDVIESTTRTAPFYNKAIDRHLTFEGLIAIAEFLLKTGRASDGGYVTGTGGATHSTKSTPLVGKRLLLFPKPIPELATDVYIWADDEGRFNHVETLFELQTQRKRSFFELPTEHLKILVNYLNKSGKAEIVYAGNGEPMGVKFFPP